MNRGTALLVAVVVLAGIVAVAPIGLAAAQDDAGGSNETSEANETIDVSPGERLSGVIGVQSAEISGEVESRAFEVGLNETETDAERAAFVAEQLNRSEQRLAEIEHRQRELRERREAGELSQGAFAARMAETSARAEQIKRETNRSAEVVRDIPEPVRTEQGLDEERLATLRERAGNATGPEVAAIARDIAGNDVGGPLAPGARGPRSDLPGSAPDRSGDGNGPPGGAGEPPANETDEASGDGANATDGSNVGERPDGGETIDVGEANVTDETNGADETNGSAGSSGDGAGGADGSDRNASGTDEASADDTDEADDRGGNRSASAVKGVIVGLSSVVDAVGDRLAATVAGESSAGA